MATYSLGQKVRVIKIAGIRGRKAIVKEVVKQKGKRTVYKLHVEGLTYPYYCTSSFIREI